MDRKEAVEWIEKAMEYQGLLPSEFWIDDEIGEAVDLAIEALSAERTGWIPCSERLPDSDRPVLVTIQWTDFDREVTVGEYWGNPTKAAPESEKGWGTYGDHVTAWREMPEPWRGERNERRGTR